MLVLSRKLNESTIIQQGGKEICRVTIVEIDRNKIRLGFTAPREIEIYREEILSRPRSGQQPPSPPCPGSGGAAGQPEHGGSGLGFDPPG